MAERVAAAIGGDFKIAGGGGYSIIALVGVILQLR